MRGRRTIVASVLQHAQWGTDEGMAQNSDERAATRPVGGT